MYIYKRKTTTNCVNKEALAIQASPCRSDRSPCQLPLEPAAELLGPACELSPVPSASLPSLPHGLEGGLVLPEQPTQPPHQSHLTLFPNARQSHTRVWDVHILSHPRVNNHHLIHTNLSVFVSSHTLFVPGKRSRHRGGCDKNAVFGDHLHYLPYVINTLTCPRGRCLSANKSSRPPPPSRPHASHRLNMSTEVVG